MEAEMKKTTLLLILALLPSLPAIGYEPSISVNSFLAMKKIGHDVARTTFGISAGVEALSMNISSDHVLSIPFTLAASSSSTDRNGYLLNASLDYSIGISYRYSFSETIAAKGQIDGIYRRILSTDGAMAGIGITAVLMIMPANYASFTIPVGLRFFKDEVDIVFSAGFSLILPGGKP